MAEVDLQRDAHLEAELDGQLDRDGGAEAGAAGGEEDNTESVSARRRCHPRLSDKMFKPFLIPARAPCRQEPMDAGCSSVW